MVDRTGEARDLLLDGLHRGFQDILLDLILKIVQSQPPLTGFLF